MLVRVGTVTIKGCSHLHTVINHATFIICCILSFFCPLRFRIAVFSVTVLHDDRIVLVAEQRPDASEEDSFQWMSRVLQVVSLSFLSFQVNKADV